jgi:hypothetical protein
MCSKFCNRTRRLPEVKLQDVTSYETYIGVAIIASSRCSTTWQETCASLEGIVFCYNYKSIVKGGKEFSCLYSAEIFCCGIFITVTLVCMPAVKKDLFYPRANRIASVNSINLSAVK